MKSELVEKGTRFHMIIDNTVNQLKQTTKETHNIKVSLIMALLSVATITAAQMLSIKLMIFLAISLYLVTLLTAKDDLLFPLLLFFLPWSTILKVSPTAISMASIGNVLIFLKITYWQKKINSYLLVSVLGLAIVTLISKVFHGYSISSSYYMFFIMLISFPVIYSSIGEKTRFNVCVHFFSIGIFSASIIAQLFGTHPGIAQYIVLFEDEYNGINRLCGFYGDPNFYAAQITTALGGLFLILTYEKNGFMDIILTIAVMGCGLISISKSFLICITIILACWFIFLMWHKNSKLLRAVAIGVVIIIVALLSGGLDNIIAQYLTRFSATNNVTSLTTGRSKLWIEYIDHFKANLPDFLIGQGYTSVFSGVHKGSHNTIIQCIYQFGFFGALFFLCWLFSWERRFQKARIPFWNRILWIVACFGMWFGLDMLFFDDFFINIILFKVGCDYIKENQEYLEKRG